MVGSYQNLSRQGSFRVRRRRRALSGLGDSALCPGPVKSQLDDIAAKLSDAQRDIVATGQQIVQASQAGHDMKEAGTLLNEQQKDLNSMISTLQYAYRTFCGTTAGGYLGLGVIPAIPLGTAAAIIAGLLAAIAAWWIYEQQLKDKVQLALQENIATAQDNLQDAIDNGDVNSQTIWQSELNNLTSAVSPTGDWLKNNWPWLVVGGIAVVVLLED
jgi:hypothetical protein